MTAIWEKLITIMHQTIQLYQTLLELSRQKREALVAVNIQEVESITRQEELLIIEAGKLEKSRQAAIEQIIARHNLSAANPTLMQVKELADEQTAARIESIGEQIASLVKELVALNQLNTKLINQSLEYINFSINVMTQAAAEPTYSPQASQPQPRSILDWKV
ncbi:MAG TPA: flagellar protein FlgN [Methylomusa anaerophila]|uniref:FlgN protein n=1 Tax=Methylomusa anaerophila TaxID=1930071 RepID=A0A348AKU2_9FIRM|nr:flagellar protein FlgN [Methylomusa anaerophila]BBB91690.1 FlgN protein [Methylomusa anaerophila]HML88576.1 flagellar protein FlgN [Methylomusa anaerophila]